MKSNYEEKTYESYFNSELDRKSEIYFPPGQVLEGRLGFDSSSYTKDRRLWRQLGHPFWFWPSYSGVNLKEIADEMEKVLGIEIDNVPDMKANILLQYKRPEFIKISSGREWKHWNRPYFRYDIYKEQQDILNRIHKKFQNQALVVYASPCFTDVDELVKNRKNLIKHSNFTKAVDLNGHRKNTYIKSGTHSIACSTPSKVRSLNLIDEIKSLGRDSSFERQMNQDVISEFSEGVLQLVDSYKYLSESFGELNQEIEQVKDYKLFYNFLVMKNFRELTGTQWLVTYNS